MPRQFYVYILTNPTHRMLYTGVTNDLKRRDPRPLAMTRAGIRPAFSEADQSDYSEVIDGGACDCAPARVLVCALNKEAT